MKKYKIYAGLGGTFGGAKYVCTKEFKTHYQAEQYAFDCASDIYDSKSGINGIRNIPQIMKEENIDLFLAEDMFYDEAETWMSYYVEEIISKDCNKK